MLTRFAVFLLTATAGFAQQAKPVDLTLEDQFEQKRTVADHKGEVIIFVYGDRKATDACRELGEKLHVLFHPTAAGKTGEKAYLAPVAPLEGLPAGVKSPNVAVIPVAVAGKVPGPVKGLIRSGIKKDVPVMPVWIDYGTQMEDKFGLRESQPNVAVLDAQGRLRLKVNGTPDKASFEKILQTAQNLRAEAAGLR